MKPTARQQRYLRDLAQLTGTTFTPPPTRAQASGEIARLKARAVSPRAERARERRQVKADLHAARHDAVRHHQGETTGYGSAARWSHHSQGTPEAGR